MILEHALLPVKPGEEAGFESAFAEAKAIIAGMPGFLRLTLSRCLERPNTYLLLVEWDRLVDHTEGFCGSPQYQEWRRRCGKTVTTPGLAWLRALTWFQALTAVTHSSRLVMSIPRSSSVSVITSPSVDFGWNSDD